MSGQWIEEYGQMLTDCEKRESKLSDWERGFIDSLEQLISKGKAPSRKQIDRLNEIWERVTA